MTQKFDSNHDVYDYYYQIGSPTSALVYDYDEFEQYIWDDLEDDFDEWINEQYKSPADLLHTLQNAENKGLHFTIQDWYWDKLCEFENYVLNNLDKFGIYLTLKEDEEGE